jgi:L-asparaginase
MSDTPTVEIFTTGGTIDKVYFDALSEYQVGEGALADIMAQAGVAVSHQITPLMRKDSLELTDDDRAQIRDAVATSAARHILITHGTDTMVLTARALRNGGAEIKDKTIVLTGAMQPNALKGSDAPFNVGFALAAAQALPSGVYIAMNGRILDPATTVKDRANHRFVSEG